MSHSTTNLDLVSQSQAGKEVTINAAFDAASPAMLYGRRAMTTAGLTWGYYGGTALVAGTPTAIANGTVTLTPSATNYVQANPATGAVSVNTTGFTAGYKQLYSIAAGASSVISYTDLRTLGGDAAGVTSVNGQDGDVVLDAADVGADASGTAADTMMEHLTDTDPHPEYLTQAEGDARYATSGDGSSAIAAHVQQSDPHIQYQRESEKGSANGYASLGADGKVPAAQLPAASGGAIGSASDAVITSPADGHLLRYDGTAGKWKNTTLALANPVYAHRSWRVLCLTTAGANYGIAEVGFRTAIGGATVTTGGTAISDGDFYGTVKTYAFDGNASTFWNAQDTAAHYIGYDHGAGNAKAIVEVALTSRNDGFYNQAPTSGKVQYSDDNNVTWTDAFSFTATWTAGGQTQVFTHPNAAAIIASAGASAAATPSDIIISAPANGQVLVYDATSGKWKNASASAAPGGSDGQLQFNDAGALGGDADMTWNKTSNVLTIGSTATPGAIKGATGGSSTGGAALTVAAGAGGTANGNTGNGGDLNLSSGAGAFNTGNGGNINILAGGLPTSANNTTGSGGNVNITGGGGFSSFGGTGGKVTIKGGYAGNGSYGGAVEIIGGEAFNAGFGGAVTIRGVDYGCAPIAIYGGSAYGAATAGAVSLTGGHAEVAAGGTGGGATLAGGRGAGSGGGSATVAGGNGTGGNSSGGDVILKPGTANGTGRPGNVVLNGNGAALSTTATGGFACVPTCAGAPTGTPAGVPTGTVPMVIDTTNAKIWMYIGGAWKGIALA